MIRGYQIDVQSRAGPATSAIVVRGITLRLFYFVCSLESSDGDRIHFLVH